MILNAKTLLLIIFQIFTHAKKLGGTRSILNWSKLNLHIEHQHFKMETFYTVLSLVEQDCCMTSLDLKDAYFSVNIEKLLNFFGNIWDLQIHN